MTRTVGQQHDNFANDIKRQMSSQATRRVLRTLPVFEVTTDLPAHLKELLDRLSDPQDGCGNTTRRI